MADVRIAAIGDVHGNARALAAALALVEQEAPDLLVWMGDLLTYGPDVDRVLDLVADTLASRHSRILRGNHDALYLDDAPLYYMSLAPWVRDCIDEVRARVPRERLRSLGLERSIGAEGICFSHANPFGHDDWRYLNSDQDHVEASLALKAGAWRAGVFAHTHRQVVYAPSSEEPCGLRKTPIEGAPLLVQLSEDALPAVINTGSVGQPRDASRRECLAVLDVDTASTLAVRFLPIVYDEGGHIEAIRRSPLPPAARERVLAFHRASCHG